MGKKGMWSLVMKKLIHKCYDRHNESFLLEFSRKLMIATQDSNKIKVIDNGDGTRSMRTTDSDKLLVNFRSENQDYDKKQRLHYFFVSDPRLPRFRFKKLVNQQANLEDNALSNVASSVLSSSNRKIDNNSEKSAKKDENTAIENNQNFSSWRDLKQRRKRNF